MKYCTLQKLICLILKEIIFTRQYLNRKNNKVEYEIEKIFMLP